MDEKKTIKKAFQFAGFWLAALFSVFIGMGSVLVAVEGLFHLGSVPYPWWEIVARMILAIVMFVGALVTGYFLHGVFEKYSGLENVF